MHISEGILPSSLLIAGAGLSVALVGVGLRKLDIQKIPQTALLTSTFFIASLIHIPLGPASVHLILNGLVGIMLGWLAFPSIMVALFLQAVLFHFGGLTTLGINTFNMALPAVAVHYLFQPLIYSKNQTISAFGAAFAGGIALTLSTLLVAGELAMAGEGLVPAAKLILVAHVPVIIVESLITALTVSFLRKVKPEILGVCLS
jgi:cobalt/nickel transport system permease protein